MLNLSAPPPPPIMLTKYCPPGPLSLTKQSKSFLESVSQYPIRLVCLENIGANQVLFGHGIKAKDNYDNCILLHPMPLPSPMIKKPQVTVFAELVASDPKARDVLHLLMCCISQQILVTHKQSCNYSYLGQLSYLVSGLGQGDVQSRVLGRIAGLFFLIPKSGEKGEYVQDKTQIIFNYFEKQGNLATIVNCYPVVVGFEIPEMCLFQDRDGFENRILDQLELSRSRIQEDNPDLHESQIFTNYIQNILTQINNLPTLISIHKAQQDIELDPGFAAYRSAIHMYHKTAQQLLNTSPSSSNSSGSSPDLPTITSISKSASITQYYKHPGSTSQQYRHKLQEYTTGRGKQLIDSYANEQLTWNLKILESEGNEVLKKVQALKVRDVGVINGYIADMGKVYDSNSRGVHRFQIWNQYMRVFLPTVLEEDPDKQNQLKNQMKRNKELQRQIDELKRQNSRGCCSSCLLM